ncbi:MAG TPA: SpoIIE family protein phosphatase [Bacteroidota bacterium]|nr:SpoIIE family protein phosphatase [Bacteroidota bacterium]
MSRGRTPRNTRQSGHPANSPESAFEMGALFEFSAIVNGTLDLQFILNHFLLTLMGRLLSLRGIILLAQRHGEFRVAHAKGLPSDLIGKPYLSKRIPKRVLALHGKSKETYAWLKPFTDAGLNFVVPLSIQGRIVGIAGFAPNAVRNKLTGKELTYVMSLANIAAAAIDKGIILQQVGQINRELDGKVQELNTLFELSKEFNAVLEQDRLIKLLMFSVMGQIGVNRFAIYLENAGRMEIVSSRLEKGVGKDVTPYFSTLNTPRKVESMNKKSDAEWKALFRAAGIHVVIPLQIQQQTKGVLALGEKIRGGEYTKTDLDFLFSVGNLAIISLENARLFKEAIEKQRLEDELQIAKEIQRGLLPKALPSIPQFDFAAINISSKQVGGDYYDVLPLEGNRFVIAIGDVSGKGAPASLLMANLQATIRALVPLGLPLGELTRRVNDLICENTGLDRFITFFWGILDVGKSTFQYSSAGHNPPFLLRADGRMERLEEGGLILGIMKAATAYPVGEIQLGAGDVLVLFTDGVTEAMNTQNEEIGEETVEGVIRKNQPCDARKILASIVDAVKEHSRNAPQYDDITVVVLKAE